MAGGQITTSLLFQIFSNTAELKRGLDSAQNTISKFGQNITKLGAGVGIAFSAQAVINFAAEVSRLGAVSEGVENSFKKLAGSTKLLEDLKTATKGAVSELSLMTKANQFASFGLDLATLPKLLAFAQAKAQATGQSVEYLADSIVTALGRRSALVLDNVGISVSSLNEEMAKTGDFVTAAGNLMERAMQGMGESVETNVTKTERLAASWENAKVQIGKAANSTGILGGAIDALSGSLDIAASSNLSFWDKLLAFAGGSTGLIAAKLADIALQTDKVTQEQKKQAQIQREVDRAFVEFGGDIQKYAAVIQTHIYKTELLAEFTKRLNDEEQKRQKSIENITNLQARQAELQQLQLVQTGQQLAATNIELKQIDEKIAKLKELGVAEAQLHNITKVPDTIQKYLDNRKTANSGTRKATFGEGVGGTQDSNELAKKNFQQLNALIDEQDGKVIKLKDSYASMGDTMDDALANIGVNAVESLGTAFADTANGSKNAFQSMIGAILGSIKQLLVALFAKALAGVISGAATSGPPPVAIALAIAGISAMTALWNKIPAFAAGGVHSGGIALVGERGPELISTGAARIYNNKDTMAMLNGGIGSGLDITVKGEIKGENIRFALAEVNRKRA